MGTGYHSWHWEVSLWHSSNTLSISSLPLHAFPWSRSFAVPNWGISFTLYTIFFNFLSTPQWNDPFLSSLTSTQTSSSSHHSPSLSFLFLLFWDKLSHITDWLRLFRTPRMTLNFWDCPPCFHLPRLELQEYISTLTFCDVYHESKTSWMPRRHSTKKAVLPAPLLFYLFILIIKQLKKKKIK